MFSCILGISAIIQIAVPEDLRRQSAEYGISAMIKITVPEDRRRQHDENLRRENDGR